MTDMARDHSGQGAGAQARLASRVMRLPDPRRALLGVTQAFVSLLRAPSGPRVALVCGAEGGEGATTVARNLAHTLAAEFGGVVCLVRIADDEPDLADAQGGGDVRMDGDAAGEVALVSLSRRSLAAALEQGLRASLGALAPRALVFVIDGPPLLNSLDASRLCGDADGLVLVVEAERTAPETLDAAAAVISGSGGRLMGAVLNKRRHRLPRFLLRLLDGEFRPGFAQQAPGTAMIAETRR
jgi:cellulose biosynthesis protein BcsQ